MFKRTSVIALGIIAGLSVVACGGGGGGGSTPPGTSTKAPAPAASASASGGSGAQSAAVAPASFKILIPSSSSSTNSTHRARKSISASTQSAVFTLVQTTATGATLNVASSPYPLTPTSPGCVAVSGGTQCTIAINAVIGTDVYTVDTYSTTTAAAGTKVGSGAFSIVVQANQLNTASLTLSGTIASVLLTTGIPDYIDTGYYDESFGSTLALAGTTSGVPTSGQVYAIALDSSGNVILSPDTYNTPITLELVGYEDNDDAIGRRRGAGFRRLQQTEPFYGQLTVTYASIDPVSGSATASVASGKTAVSIYSPEDIITLSTTANDVYYQPYQFYESYGFYPQEYIGVFGSASGATNATPAPNTYSLPNNQLAIAVLPLVTPPPSTAPSPSPSPSASPAITTIAFTGLSLNTPEPSPSPSASANPTSSPSASPTMSAAPSPSPTISIAASPNPLVVGIGPAVGTYASDIVSASLDLETFGAGNTVSVYLSDTYPAGSAAPTFSISGSSACASVPYFTGLTSVAQIATQGTNIAYYRFSFIDQLPSGTYGDSSGNDSSDCVLTLIDSYSSIAKLEVYQNQNTITVDARKRKK